MQNLQSLEQLCKSKTKIKLYFLLPQPGYFLGYPYGAHPSYFGSSVNSTNPEDYLHKLARGGWACLACGRPAPQKAKIIRHALAKHIRIKSLGCKLCPMKFSTENNQQVHYKKKHDLNLALSEIRAMEEQEDRDPIECEQK